jgi:hypothetical protein
MLIMPAVSAHQVQFWTSGILNILFPDTKMYETGIKVVC